MSVDRRERMRKSLQQRTQDDFEHGGESTMYGDIFEEIEGLKKWKCSKGVHQGDIIPYIAGDKDPKTKVGETSHVLHIWVHQRVGVNQESFVCPTMNYKQPCPICEHREKIRSQEEYDDDLVKSFYPKHRNVYNWLCFDDAKEEAKGVQVWEVSDFLMGEKLRSLSKMPDRGGKGGGYIYYADPDTGKTIKFERKGEGKENTQYLGHQFIDREYKIPDDILDQAFQLDQIIHIPTYEEIRDAFFVGEEGSPNDREFEEPTTEEETTPPTSREEETTPPTSRRSLRSGSEVTSETEKQTPTGSGLRTSRVKAENQCPYGGTLGIDCEQLNECKECDIWDNCSIEHHKLAANQGEAKSTPPIPSRRPPSSVPVPSGKGSVSSGPLLRRRGTMGKK